MQLALGTVQFGLAYGIAGRGEAVPEAEVRAILEDAAAQGVTTLDTAADALRALQNLPGVARPPGLVGFLIVRGSAPNDTQIYIDGFAGGVLPPKASIREIRINQNPFSAEYDKLGMGRIEVFTKPGSEKTHGQLSVTDSSNSLERFGSLKWPKFNERMFVR